MMARRAVCLYEQGATLEARDVLSAMRLSQIGWYVALVEIWQFAGWKIADGLLALAAERHQ